MRINVTGYCSQLSQEVGRGWNRFWFTPSDPLVLCMLRIGTGLLALVYLASLTPGLSAWFGLHGLMSTETVAMLRETGPGYDWIHFSYLDLVASSSALWISHVLGLLVLLLFTLGTFTRVTSILAWLVMLSYLHRQPIVTGPFEPVMAMLLFYLCLGPCGAYLSIDQWRRTGRCDLGAGESPRFMHWTVTVSVRLVQLHCAGFYLLMGLSKLAGVTWWEGEAVWSLMAQVRSRPLDLTFLREREYLLEAWTHAIVGFELAFPLLIWKPLLRPLLWCVAIVMWSLLALLTGLTGFCLVMLMTSGVFLSSECYRGWFGRGGFPVLSDG